MTSQDANDTFFIAYHFPYTYSDLQLFLDSIQRNQGGYAVAPPPTPPENDLNSINDSESQSSYRPPSVPSSNSPHFDRCCRRQTLCHTIAGNEVDLLTITAFDKGIYIFCVYFKLV